MKKIYTITFMLFIFFLPVIMILSCNSGIVVDPLVPRGTYTIKYFEKCNLKGRCSIEVQERFTKDLNDYFKTFWSGNYLWLAYNYKSGELYRKYVFDYDKLHCMTRVEYRSGDDELLSYKILHYDEHRNLIKIVEYLRGDQLAKITEYIYEDFDKIGIIDVKDYSEEEFVRREYIVLEYDVDGEVIRETNYDTYLLVFKHAIGELTHDFISRYCLKNPDIIEHELVKKEEDYTAYTILHLKTNPEKIAQKFLLSLSFVGEIRDVYTVEYSRGHIISFLVSD